MTPPPIKVCPDTIVGFNTEGEPVTLSRVLNARDEMREWFSIKITTGAYSERIVDELAIHWCRLPQIFGRSRLLIDCHAVLEQIGVLEGAPQNRAAPTKPAKPFSGPLTGLWGKHWFQASFILNNLMRENEKYGESLIYRALNKKFGRNGWHDRPVGDVAGIIPHAAVIDALENRVGRLANSKDQGPTGEWIIFTKSGGRNIYLTLASHSETNQEILARCKSAISKFPELKTAPPFLQ
ncbi:MAG: hypothetical protein HC841_02315 [Verrucomicrobiae bacterium]|nr:hypothetical protein [Verrucomicrobiae bacterium]